MGKVSITAEFEIVTPMFLGDAGHDASRIREMSIKGALAFWWRALNYSRFVGEADGNQRAALEKMQKKEREIFGGGDDGQSSFLLKVAVSKRKRIAAYKSKEILKDADGKVVGVGARYLGYGLMEAFDSKKKNKRAGQLTRSCFEAGSKFKVQMVFRPLDGGTTAVGEVLPALKVFGLLGGLGSRVRRGWGSVSLVGLKGEGIDEEWSSPASRDEYESVLKGLIPECVRELSGKEWYVTAFAKETDIRIGEFGNEDALVVLNRVGEGLQRYRGWKNGEKSFVEDHDWFKAGRDRPMSGTFVYGNGEDIDAKMLPKRAAFGLPHNYFSPGRNGSDRMKMDVGGENRRGSPLMFHVHRCGGSAFAVAAFFPVVFLGEDSKVSVDKGKKTFVFDGSVISDFLDGRRHGGGKPAKGEYFPSRRVSL